MLEKILRFSLSLFIILFVSAAAQANWMTRPGTIGHALSLTDGSHVYLDAVEISKIRSSQAPPYFVITECFSQQDRIIVLAQPSTELRMGQTVDIEGDLVTLDSGDRAITNATVWGYTDSSGTLLYHGPLIKGIMVPTLWNYKVNLTVIPFVSRSATPAQSESMLPGEVNTSSSVQVVPCATIAYAKAQALETVVEIRCHPISSGGTGSFILGEDGDTDTLTVNYTGTVNPTSRVCVVRGTIDTTDGTNRVLDVDSGPNYNVQESTQGSLLMAAQGSIAWVKSWADEHTFVIGDITGKIVTRNWTDYLYIEEDSRASGIRVEQTAHGRVKGERVNVVGTLATNTNGERYIAATGITFVEYASLTPLGMNNKWLGGGDFGYVAGPPISGQRGVTGASGLNNIGLLVKTWGKVTEIYTATSPQWFKINDGSNVSTKVAYPPFSYALGNYVAITGISSCEVDTSSNLQRVLRPQPLNCATSKAGGQNILTNTSPVNFIVTFSDAVSDFDDTDDVSITAAGNPQPTITPIGTDNKQFNVAVSGMTSGTVIATVPSGKAKDGSGVWNYASVNSNNSVVFDNNAPYATNVTSSSANRTYSVGEAIDIRVQFNESITVTDNPQLILALPGSPVATYSSKLSDTLIFSYTVKSGDDSNDLDYLNSSSLSGTIKDAAGNNANLTLPQPGATGSLGSNMNIVVRAAWVSSPAMNIKAVYQVFDAAGAALTSELPYPAAGLNMYATGTETLFADPRLTYRITLKDTNGGLGLDTDTLGSTTYQDVCLVNDALPTNRTTAFPTSYDICQSSLYRYPDKGSSSLAQSFGFDTTQQKGGYVAFTAEAEDIWQSLPMTNLRTTPGTTVYISTNATFKYTDTAGGKPASGHSAPNDIVLDNVNPQRQDLSSTATTTLPVKIYNGRDAGTAISCSPSGSYTYVYTDSGTLTTLWQNKQLTAGTDSLSFYFIRYQNGTITWPTISDTDYCIGVDSSGLPLWRTLDDSASVFFKWKVTYRETTTSPTKVVEKIYYSYSSAQQISESDFPGGWKTGDASHMNSITVDAYLINPTDAPYSEPNAPANCWFSDEPTLICHSDSMVRFTL